MIPLVREAALDALAVLWPVSCAGCGEPDRAVCAACRAALRPAVRVRLVGELPVASALTYAGPVRQVLLAVKEQGRTDAAGALAIALATAVAVARRASGPVELVRVPSSRAGLRRRGFDPVRLICRRAGVRTAGVLLPARRTAAQKRLGVADRAANVAGAFVASGPLVGRRVLLIDDVVTTGATIAEAARACRAAGAEVVGAVSIAFTERRSTEP